MSSGLIFKDINLIFFEKTFFTEPNSATYTDFILGLSFQVLVEQKTPQNTKNMSSELIFKDINLIFLKKIF